MKKIPIHIQQLIAKALRGKIDEDEQRILDEWYRKSDSQNGIEILEPKKINIKKGLRRTKSKIEKRPNSSIIWPFMAAAGLALIILILRPHLILEKSNSTDTVLINEFETVFNPRGMRRMISLADGSKVWMRGESKLQIHKQFSINRKLILEGEAFFEVSKDSLHPFRVFTELAVTEVLGTSFLLDTKKQQQSTAVKSGVVVVKPLKPQISSDSAQTLVALQRSEWTRDGGFGNIEVIDPEVTFGWMEGTIFFKETPIRNVLAELEEWYGLEEIVIVNLAENCRVTGTYTRMSLEEIMESIKYATGLNYRINGKKLEVSEGNC